MDALRFFGLARAEDDPDLWHLPVVPALCSGRGTLFGGCGLGAAIEALERTTRRPLVWATAQYLSYARPPSVVDIAITEIVRGHRSSQARAVARVDGEEIFTVTAALGARDFPLSGSWAIHPDVPSPRSSPARETLPRHEGTIMDRLEARLAAGRNFQDLPGPPGDGRAALWVHLPGLDMSAAALAIVGDFVPFGVGQALGERAGGNSLDNTLRVVTRHPTEWILADVRIHAVQHGFGHGLVHLWAEDGTLLGTASQSAIVRKHRDWDEDDRTAETAGDSNPAPAQEGDDP
ncbi:MAG TPA: thioesterase family protein [Acidimicrobiia bacterium]|nr:thioesterase family protein [Acidimicrobiia bacterium]